MKRNDISPRPRAGFTMLEALLAVFISTLLFITVLFVYDAYARMTHGQGLQADLQEQLMVVRRVMEKDVHMSGYSLPGNGITILNAATVDPTPVFLSNENDKHTQLSADAAIGASVLLVNDASGVYAGQWVCLAKDTMISYYKIKRLGHNGAGNDSCFLQDTAVQVFWDHALTQVSFAKAAYYSLEYQNGSLRLVRHSSTGSQALGPSIDSVSYVPKDTSGVITWSDYAKVLILQITIGGPSPVSNTPFRVCKTFDAMIRN